VAAVTPVAPVAARQPVPINGVIVEFTDGQLTVRANNATLSEVLFQIQKKTGAEIAIPSGTEQDRVAAEFGPDTPSEVLSQLLNGSGLNFVVVGSESNPKILRSVLLTRMDPDMSSAVQPYSPPVAQNMQMEAPDQSFVAPPPEMGQPGMPEDNPQLQNAPDVAPQLPPPDPPNN
jgi:type II secretory pathway component GspD/PulD (secretin)